MPFKLLLAMNLTILLLFGLMFALIAGVGYYFNFSVIVVVTLALAMVGIQWFIGPWIISATTNMRPLERGEYPWLWEAVSGIAKKNKIPMPKKLFLAHNGAPNAFVYGRTPGSANLVVTQGLLNMLNKDEIKAVVSHEMGHIKHFDMVVMTLAGVVPLIAYYIAINFLYLRGGTNDDRRSGGSAILIGIGAYLVYIISNLLVLALSRTRESYADDFGGRTYKPKLLASALAKITYGLGTNKESKKDALRSFYIADPITSNFEISHFSHEYSDLEITESEVKKAIEWERNNWFARIGELFRTHPLTFRRIDALMKLDKELS